MAIQTYTIGAAGDYTTWSAAEVDFEAGTLSGASSADDIVFQEIDGAAYNETLRYQVNPGGYSSLTLTASESARHDGTAGSGARIVGSGTVNTLEWNIDCTLTVEWLEFDGNSSGRRLLWLRSALTAGPYVVRDCILHNLENDTTPTGINCTLDPGAGVYLLNNLIYDIGSSTAAGNAAVEGISVSGSYPTVVANNTIYGLYHSAADSTGTVKGISVLNDTSGVVIRNNAVAGVTSAGSGAADDWDVAGTTNGTYTHNASEDATHPGTSGQTIAGSDWVDAANDDFQPSSGSTLFEAGVDLGTTPSGVEVDITGRDRDASADTWSIGAWQLEAAATGLTLTASPATITDTPQSAGLNISRTLTASPASITVTPQSAGLTTAHTLTASPASITVTGQSSTLTIASAGLDDLTASPAAIVVTPQVATLSIGRIIAAAAASVTVTPQSATLTIADTPDVVYVGKRIASVPGSKSFRSIPRGVVGRWY